MKQLDAEWIDLEGKTKVVAENLVKPTIKRLTVHDDDLRSIIKDLRNQEAAINDLLLAVFLKRTQKLEAEKEEHKRGVDYDNAKKV
jgi:NRPS condensation-like uncharacterized protein